MPGRLKIPKTPAIGLSVRVTLAHDNFTGHVRMRATIVFEGTLLRKGEAKGAIASQMAADKCVIPFGYRMSGRIFIVPRNYRARRNGESIWFEGETFYDYSIG